MTIWRLSTVMVCPAMSKHGVPSHTAGSHHNRQGRLGTQSGGRVKSPSPRGVPSQTKRQRWTEDDLTIRDIFSPPQAPLLSYVHCPLFEIRLICEIHLVSIYMCSRILP